MAIMKSCVRCGLPKGLSEFGQNKNTRDGKQSQCRPCATSQVAEIQAAWRLLAIEVLGSKCQHCGIEDVRVLVVDHVNGGGNAHRRLVAPATLWRKIAKREVDLGEYQALCHNCNFLKRILVDRRYKDS